MIHYTPLPLEVVMDGIEKMEHNGMDITVNGILMQVQPINATQATIVRIVSGNPQHYLIPQYSPGQVIEFQPVT